MNVIIKHPLASLSLTAQTSSLRLRAATLGLYCVLLTLQFVLPAVAQNSWSIDQDGGITWSVEPGKAHQDHIEMSGKKVSVIVTYGVDQAGRLTLSRHVVFPMLRFAPNKTRDHLALVFADDAAPRYFIDRAAPRGEIVRRVHHKGIMQIESVIGRNRDVSLIRTIFPSVDKPLVIEAYTFTNNTEKDVAVEVESTEKVVRTNPSRGIYGGYIGTSRVQGSGERVLKPKEAAIYAILFSARKADEPELVVDIAAEEKARRDRIEDLLAVLQLETPDPVLNTAFAFAKIRAAESIYETKGGLMHGPGGGAYYAAIWANDQAEYANPFFAYLGDATASQSALNSYRHFARYMNPEFKPIPSSIISEGEGFWHGAKDRGDMAMIAYGASRFALAYGRTTAAAELWPLVEWCLEYCHRKLNDQGVVTSDSDELENRFPAGKANLCTSSLYYDALVSAAILGRELGKPASLTAGYSARAGAVRAAIDKYFGANVEGFETYRYYDGNTVLRAWICIPLTTGILDRKEGTIAALFSPRLWTEDGLATQAGEKTFWDRSTLYALRGVFAAGAIQKGLDYLRYYSNRRLLGDHVPYPVEAYPEGNQRHLSAESALYCRIFTEGLFGIRPTGLRTFDCTPRLPADWPGMKVKNVQAFGAKFDLEVSRASGKLQLEIIRDGKALPPILITEGETASIRF